MGRKKLNAETHNLSFLPDDWEALLKIHPSPSEAIRELLAFYRQWRSKK